MPTTRPQSPDVTEILARERIADALAALTDPTRDGTDAALSLSETDRRIIQQAIGESPHPLSGFAHDLIDQWDYTTPHDRAAALLLFSEITVEQKRRQNQNLERSPGLGLGR
jgi:hypothetical protein